MGNTAHSFAFHTLPCSLLYCILSYIPWKIPDNFKNAVGDFYCIYLPVSGHRSCFIAITPFSPRSPKWTTTIIVAYRQILPLRLARYHLGVFILPVSALQMVSFAVNALSVFCAAIYHFSVHHVEGSEVSLEFWLIRVFAFEAFRHHLPFTPHTIP